MAAIRVSLSFRRESESQLASTILRIHDRLLGNSHFPSPPVPLADLDSARTTYVDAIIAAKDRGRALIAARAKQRQVVIRLLRELAAYVQFTAKGDISKIYTSGFDVASRNTTPTQLPKPVLLRTTNVASTQLGLKVKPIKNARMYEVWIHTGDENWRPWQLFQNTRRMILKNLTPGTTYWIRLRALGGSTGYSDWTDVTSHMST